MPTTHKSSSPHPGSSGFSLLEAIIGIAVLSFLAVGAMLFSRNSILSNTMGRESAKCSTVLKDFLEGMRVLDINSIPRNKEMTDSSGPFKIVWTAFDETSSEKYRQPPGLVLICVRITYVLYGGSHAVEATTLLGRE